MKKTDKKIANSVRVALSSVCELAVDDVPGFKWLSHLASYSDFPRSLRIICVFDTNNDLSNAYNFKKDDFLYKLIKEKLSAAGVNIKDIRQHVRFDTEEACANESGGKWSKRFR